MASHYHAGLRTGVSESLLLDEVITPASLPASRTATTRVHAAAGPYRPRHLRRGHRPVTKLIWKAARPLTRTRPRTSERQHATMPAVIDRTEELRLLAEHDGQLVEVLPHAEYEEEHLDQAMHVPLKQMDTNQADMLDRDRPVVVYCRFRPR